VATTLDSPPIRLIPRTPLTSPLPGSFPIPTMGTETQEPDAPNTVTSSVSHKVAETQEPATHSVAETQEPAADIEIELQQPDAQTSFVSNKVAETQPATHPVAETQEPATDIEIELQESQAQDVATPPSSSKVAEKPATHSVAETQEPAADTEIDIQDLEVEGAATLLFLHQEAETQAAATIPAAPSQQPEATMESVLQENKFLKSELEAYKQELTRAKEAYEKELNSYTLSRIATLSEQTTESLCKEYMCCQCGDIYYQAGYKVIQVPVPGAAPTPSPFEVKEEPVATQEPAGPTKLKTELAATQEPTGPSKLKTNLLQHKNQQALPGSRLNLALQQEKPLLLSTRLCKQCPWRNLYLPIRSISPPPGNNLLKPYLIPLLPTLKHRLSYGMSMQKYKNGRKNMLKHRPKTCKCTDKPG
jgi:hypothetical protein